MEGLPLGRTPDFDITNARVTFVDGDGRWELAGWVTNLADEHYAEGVFFVAPFILQFQVPGAPRLWGVGATYRF